MEEGQVGDLNEILNNTYEALKSRITLSSTTCTTYTNQSAGRQVYFSTVLDAVEQQRARDGSATTVSQFDAGLYTVADTFDPDTVSTLKKSTVCGLLINPKTHAAAQGIPEQGSLFGRYVYLNTQPKSFGEIKRHWSAAVNRNSAT
jgi:hypothetical protein